MIGLLLLPLSAAAEVPLESFIADAPQPLSSAQAFSTMLETACGPIETTEVTLTGSRIEYTTARCEALYLPDPGRFSIRFLDADIHAARPTRVHPDGLRIQNEADLQLLASLGFDVGQLGDSFTRDIAVETLALGGQPFVEFAGTLTGVERAFGDLWVAGSRLSVVRDANGDLQELVGTWPEIDADSDLRDEDVPLAPEVYPTLLGVPSSALIDTRATLEPTDVIDGHVVAARSVTHVTWRVPGPNGSQAAVGVYFEGATALWVQQ